MSHLETAGERPVLITAGAAYLPGTLAWPRQPSGMVFFVQPRVTVPVLVCHVADNAEAATDPLLAR